MLDTTANDLRVCPFCGLLYEGTPNRCYDCGMLINEGAEDVERLIRSDRKLLRTRKRSRTPSS